MHYEQLDAYRITADDVDQINQLLAQLTEKPVPLTETRLMEICNSSILCVVREPTRRIVGMATLNILFLPTGKVAHLDDVVVDVGYRRRGIARAITQSMIARAGQRKVDRLELTSNPTRVEAIDLYKSLGFELTPTNKGVLKF